MTDLPPPPNTSGDRARRITGKALGAGAGAIAGSFVANPALGALAGAAAGEGIEQAVHLVTAKMKDPAVSDAAIDRFRDFLGEYLQENPDRMDEVVEIAKGSKEYLDDALTTYAALHKQIATQTQGVRQEVLMRGLAHLATSEEPDVATFSHASQTVMNLTRRQLGMLALLDKEGRTDPRLLLSEFSAGKPGIDPFEKPAPNDFAKVSRYKEIYDLMASGLVMQTVSQEQLQGMAPAQRVETIRSSQPRDWSEIDVTRLDLSAAGYVIAEALDLGQLDISVQQELLKELDPVGQRLMTPDSSMRIKRPYPVQDLDGTRPKMRPYDQEIDDIEPVQILEQAAQQITSGELDSGPTSL